MSFGRPLGQCCRNCRQHCTGLALRTPGSASALPPRTTNFIASRRAVPAVACARAARAGPRHAGLGHVRRSAAPHGVERAKPGCRGARAQCNAAGCIGSIGRAVARRGSPVREQSAHGTKQVVQARATISSPARGRRSSRFARPCRPSDRPHRPAPEPSRRVDARRLVG